MLYAIHTHKAVRNLTEIRTKVEVASYDDELQWLGQV